LLLLLGFRLAVSASGDSITVRNLAFHNGYRQEVNFDNNNRGGGLYIRVKTSCYIPLKSASSQCHKIHQVTLALYTDPIAFGEASA
jgi:hypothetical protein